MIQKSLVAKKCESSKGSISKEISALRLRVNDFSTSPVRFFRIDVHGTSMDDYFSAFRNSPKAKKGKVLQKPTLASVDLDHYEQWLIDVADKQAEKKYSYRSSYQQKRPKSRERRESQQDQAQLAVNEYMSRIRKIRLLLVDIRQITDDFMKNRNR